MLSGDAGQRPISSHWLLVFVFSCILVSGAWIGTPAWYPLIALCVVAIGVLVYFSEVPISVPDGPRPLPGPNDWVAVAIASAPLLAYLIATWSQEFPHGGDQVYHNGAALEAFGFWWWLPWCAAVIALIFVIRIPSLALPMLVVLMGIGLLTAQPLAFAGRYPGTLHFLSVPFRLLPVRSPLNVERVINASSVPVWLLVLRPFILRRRIDIGSFAAALFFFWQKDVVYYFTSGYLEPWAIVLLLTAGEHLVRFGSEMIWRPLLLISAASLIKDQAVLSLPVVALMYFPFRASWRERVQYATVVLAAGAPLLLFFFARLSFRSWQPAYPTLSAFKVPHIEAAIQQIRIEFGASLPMVAIAFAILLLLAVRRYAFTALFACSMVNVLVFFTAVVLQEWPGYPRGNLVPVAYAAIAVGSVVEWFSARSRASAWAALGIIAMLNGVVFSPFLRDALRPDSTRNFVEHSDAPIFYPIREAVQRAEIARFIQPGATISLLENGKWTYPFFYPGPVQEQYPDLARRYRFRVKSFAFADGWRRCRCSSGETNIALFIRFQNLGPENPNRLAMESEAQQCRQEMLATCSRTMPIEHEGVEVALIGAK